mmetsp:Transcript_73101/g.89684  ORF Transcript_73101/g.89684 Transcript_73101/m.89684 type:complete len:132 (+) Transcript_73101:48-443(+)
MGNLVGAVGGGAIGALVGGPVGLVIGGAIGGTTGTVAEVVNSEVGETVHRGSIHYLNELNAILDYRLTDVKIGKCDLSLKSTNTIGAIGRGVLAPASSLDSGSFWLEHWWIIIEVQRTKWDKKKKRGCNGL